VRLHTLLIFFSVVGGLLLFGAAELVLGPLAVAATRLLLDVRCFCTSDARTPS
jgi:predicted PurR-regulated permease PerM